jgi:outer membrane protein OmpA-like peptidoglycan-associated protein
MTRTNRRTLIALVATAIAAIGGLAPSTANAENPTLITGDPVPARELAQMLYPLRTRGIVMNDAPAAPTPFGFLIQFEYDSAEVKPESRPYLDEVGKMMSLPQLRGRKVMVVGHADATGDEAYNQSLSELRARAIGRYLERHHGVASEQVVTAGRGESDPMNPANPYDAKNRRVQFHPVN